MLLVAVILWGLAVDVSACHKSYCMLHLYNQCILIQETVMLSKKKKMHILLLKVTKVAFPSLFLANSHYNTVT